MISLPLALSRVLQSAVVLTDIREKQITGEMTDSEQARVYAGNFLKDMRGSE